MILVFGRAAQDLIENSKRGHIMNSNELISGEGFDPENLPVFNGELVKLHEYGSGSCFGCGGMVTCYKETGSGRILNLCMKCGEVVQSPRKVNGKLQDGFEPGTAPPPLRDENLKF